MPANLFEELSVSGPRRKGASRLRALPFSLSVHALAVAALGFAAARPAASALDEAADGVVIYQSDPKPAAQHEADPARPTLHRSVPDRTGSGGPPAAIPTGEPDRLLPEPPGDLPAAVCLTNCGAGSGTDDGPGGGPAGPGSAGSHDGVGPYDVGGDIRPPRKLHDALPVYPELARRAGVQGVVIIRCVIDESGRVVDVRILKGQLLLDEAALDAVRQWSYEPTLLNGRPIPVAMTVTVRFFLRR